MSSTLSSTQVHSLRPFAGPLGADVHDEIAHLFPRRAATPMDVLNLLAASDRAMSRQEICRVLTIAPKTLSECMVVLEREGFMVSSRRFMVTLGARFLDDVQLSRVFRDTTLALVRPHLEVLSATFDGTASIAFPSGASCIVADTSGQLDRTLVSETSGGVLSQAIRGVTALHPSPALNLGGLWAGLAAEERVVIASRVELRCSAAAVGLTTRALTLDEFSEVSRAVVNVAQALTSALRRVYPSSSPFGANGDRDDEPC